MSSISRQIFNQQALKEQGVLYWEKEKLVSVTVTHCYFVTFPYCHNDYNDDHKEMSHWYSENTTDLRKSAVGITEVLFPGWPGFCSYWPQDFVALEYLNKNE